MEPIRKCAWCEKPLTPLNSKQDASNVTHGLCESCRIDLEYRRIPLQNLIDKVSFPVLVTDEKLRILYSNTSLEHDWHKNSEELQNKLPGEFLECIYADLPGGCGETSHCTACTLRKTLENTFETGKSYNGIKSFHYIKNPDGSNKRVNITISTQKVGKKVMVQITQAL